MMTIVEKGSGPALVAIPGIQGRWEYIAQAIDALSTGFRVLTFPLCDEPSSGIAFDETLGFDNYVEQVRRVLDERGIDRAIVCGISFGGVVALRFAALHASRTAGLVLTSTPGPGWHLRRRHEVYARLPYVFGPLFLAETPLRLRREMAASHPRRGPRWRFAAAQLGTLIRAPLSLPLMARRARLIGTVDLIADSERVDAPTLVVTGERGLDHVVPVDQSVGYVSLIRGARGVVLERTGHLGSITRPDRFAAIVRGFADRDIRGIETSDAHAHTGPTGPEVVHVA
jgi:pimeloyl-ACP methyl ester carboxylesterase